jgi:hypothetical protein
VSRLSDVPASHLLRVRKLKKAQRRETINATPTQSLLQRIGGEGMDCALTMVLVKWTVTELTQFTRLVVAVMNRRADLAFEETRFADQTEVQADNDRVISFRRFYAEVLEGAMEPSPPEEAPHVTEERRTHYRTVLRACFVIALVCDVRVRRFVMAHHDVHFLSMLYTAPNREETNNFIDQMQECVAAFLARQISLADVASSAVDLWRHSLAEGPARCPVPEVARS